MPHQKMGHESQDLAVSLENLLALSVFYSICKQKGLCYG